MRQKTNVTAPSEREALECMKSYTDSCSQLKKLEGEIEIKLNAIRDKYKAKSEQLKEVRDDSFQKLQTYAVSNKDSLFVKKKSIDWVHGILGFRTGTPKVNKKSGITWVAMIDLLKGQNKASFIRTKEEIDKDKILSSRDDKKIMTELAGLGIKVIQDETFFVEPKEENITS